MRPALMFLKFKMVILAVGGKAGHHPMHPARTTQGHVPTRGAAAVSFSRRWQEVFAHQLSFKLQHYFLSCL